MSKVPISLKRSIRSHCKVHAIRPPPYPRSRAAATSPELSSSTVEVLSFEINNLTSLISLDDFTSTSLLRTTDNPRALWHIFPEISLLPKLPRYCTRSPTPSLSSFSLSASIRHPHRSSTYHAVVTSLETPPRALPSIVRSIVAVATNPPSHIAYWMA